MSSTCKVVELFKIPTNLTIWPSLVASTFRVFIERDFIRTVTFASAPKAVNDPLTTSPLANNAANQTLNSL
jgi:hypothetical protein